jgi:integrase
MLRKALADACRKGSLLRNVADLADPPKPSAYGNREMRVWTPAQLRQFLEEIDDHRLAPAFFLAANTGMRRGEVLGLRWDDVDLDAARLSVRHAVLNVAYELVLADVKTKTSRRTTDLAPEASPCCGPGGRRSSRSGSRSAGDPTTTASSSPRSKAARHIRTCSARFSTAT